MNQRREVLFVPSGVDGDSSVLVDLGSVTPDERDLVLRGLETLKRELLQEALSFAHKRLTFSGLEEVNKRGAECFAQARAADRLVERWAKKPKDPTR